MEEEEKERDEEEREEEKAGEKESFDQELALIGWLASFHATSNDVDAWESAFRMVWA
jgi:hypothetical protein